MCRTFTVLWEASLLEYPLMGISNASEWKPVHMRQLVVSMVLCESMVSQRDYQHIQPPFVVWYGPMTLPLTVWSGFSRVATCACTCTLHRIRHLVDFFKNCIWDERHWLLEINVYIGLAWMGICFLDIFASGVWKRLPNNYNKYDRYIHSS